MVGEAVLQVLKARCICGSEHRMRGRLEREGGDVLMELCVRE